MRELQKLRVRLPSCRRTRTAKELSVRTRQGAQAALMTAPTKMTMGKEAFDCHELGREMERLMRNAVAAHLGQMKLCGPSRELSRY